MKKTFVMAALVAVAAIFASCEKVEPTALEPENLNGKLTVAGLVQLQTYKEDSKTLVPSDLQIMRNQAVVVLYGTDDGAGNKTYVEYSATTDGQGFYSIDLPVAIGQAIDEVKVQLNVFLEGQTYGYWVDDKFEKRFERVDAWFEAEVIQAPAAAGHTYGLDLTLEPVKAKSEHDLTLK